MYYAIEDSIEQFAVETSITLQIRAKERVQVNEQDADGQNCCYYFFHALASNHDYIKHFLNSHHALIIPTPVGVEGLQQSRAFETNLGKNGWSEQTDFS